MGVGSWKLIPFCDIQQPQAGNLNGNSIYLLIRTIPIPPRQSMNEQTMERDRAKRARRRDASI
jgi:hypothetical protein